LLTINGTTNEAKTKVAEKEASIRQIFETVVKLINQLIGLNAEGGEGKIITAHQKDVFWKSLAAKPQTDPHAKFGTRYGHQLCFDIHSSYIRTGTKLLNKKYR
jgi:hypothetical protein